MEPRYVKYEIDRTVMFDFLDQHWYINGIRPPTNQYRQLYLQYCMDEKFKEIEKSFIKSKKRTSSKSSGNKKKKKNKKFSFSIKL